METWYMNSGIFTTNLEWLDGFLNHEQLYHSYSAVIISFEAAAKNETSKPDKENNNTTPDLQHSFPNHVSLSCFFVGHVPAMHVLYTVLSKILYFWFWAKWR